jgi:predicted phage terminase large subunit-like protein
LDASSLARSIPPSLRASTLEKVQAQLAKRSLRAFLPWAWNWIEPREFRSNWHIDAICDHLEAVNRGEIRRLLINIPPRHAKSLVTSVFWPAWTWIQDPMNGLDGYMLPTIGKGARFLCASYSDRLSLRDSLRTRQIVQNPIYQRNFGVRLSPDQKSKSRFDLVKGGYRVATSTGGMATGEGGDILLVDDPHNVKQAESPTVREETVRWFGEVLPTRFNDPRRGAMVVVMQRVHERDVSGYILAEELGYTHLCLPAEYEPLHPHVWKDDPRKELGELLWPSHISRTEIEELRRSLGSYAYAGQVQQRPAPREGGMFKRHWIRLCEQLPSNRVRVRAWDLAGSLTGFDPDWTVGLLMSRDPDGFIFIEDVQRFRATPGEVERQIKATAALDGKKTTVVLPQDPGSAGKAQVSYLTRALQGYRVKCNRVSGDKETRAGPFASQCEHGNVMMLRAPWNEEVLGELCTFPNGRHDDIVDAASDAFNELAEARCGAGSLPMVW